MVVATGHVTRCRTNSAQVRALLNSLGMHLRFRLGMIILGVDARAGVESKGIVEARHDGLDHNASVNLDVRTKVSPTL